MQPPNYSTKAISDLLRCAEMQQFGPQDRQGLRFVADLLRRAEIFVLPDAGELLERSKPRLQVPGLIYRPPFPVVALEYRAKERDRDHHPVYEATKCSKRIALAWQWDGRTPGGSMQTDGIGESVMIASICYFDSLGFWMPMCAGISLPFDCEYQTPAQTGHRDALVESGRISKKQAATPTIAAKEVLVLMPNWFGRLIDEHTYPGALDMLSSDLMDEVNSYLDLCLALGCGNVSAELQRQPERLNKRRIKAGKLPLRDFHVLSIGGAASSDGFGTGQGGGVRSHLRRGHVRRLGQDRITWVNACMVRGSRSGFVDKVYSPRVCSV